jgi:hypothetical protein
LTIAKTGMIQRARGMSLAAVGASRPRRSRLQEGSMNYVKRFMAIAALAAAGLPAQALAATPMANGTPANAAQAGQPSTPPAVRNGGAHRVDPVASAASGAHDDADVRTTASDGRPATRNAHERSATTAASSPSSPNN